MFRFTIRDLVLITAMMGFALAWWIDRRRLTTAQDRLHAIVSELASRNVQVEFDSDGVWLSNP